MSKVKSKQEVKEVKSEQEVKEVKSIIVPEILIEGDSHPFQDMEAEGSLPEVVSVGYARVSPTSRDYVAYTIVSKGDKVISMTVSEPNVKAVAIDVAKVSFVRNIEKEF